MYATEATRVSRRLARGAWMLVLALAGCSLNPQPDDPNIQSSVDPRGNNIGGASGSSGSTGFGGFPSMVPPPGAGGTVTGGIGDAGISPGGSGPIGTPAVDGGAEKGDAGPDSGDASPDRRPSPTHD
jgi:hypothetical protein